MSRGLINDWVCMYACWFGCEIGWSKNALRILFFWIFIFSPHKFFGFPIKVNTYFFLLRNELIFRGCSKSIKFYMYFLWEKDVFANLRWNREYWMYRTVPSMFIFRINRRIQEIHSFFIQFYVKLVINNNILFKQFKKHQNIFQK